MGCNRPNQWLASHGPNVYGTVVYASSTKLRKQLYCELADVLLHNDSAFTHMYVIHACDNIV